MNWINRFYWEQQSNPSQRWQIKILNTYIKRKKNILKKKYLAGERDIRSGEVSEARVRLSPRGSIHGQALTPRHWLPIVRQRIHTEAGEQRPPRRPRRRRRRRRRRSTFRLRHFLSYFFGFFFFSDIKIKSKNNFFFFFGWGDNGERKRSYMIWGVFINFDLRQNLWSIQDKKQN